MEPSGPVIGSLQPRVARPVAGREQHRADPLRRRSSRAARAPHRTGRGLSPATPHASGRPVRRMRRRGRGSGASGSRRRPRLSGRSSAKSALARTLREPPGQPDPGTCSSAGRARVWPWRRRGRPAASTAHVGRPRGRAPRRSCGPAGRCSPATSRCPCRGTGGASGCADRPPASPRGRTEQLVGDLDAGGGGPDDQHAALGELRGVAVVAGGEHVDSRQPGRHVRACRAVRWR